MTKHARASLASSARHRVITRWRLVRMRPRRARYMRALPASAPVGVPPGPTAPIASNRVLVIAHVYYPELWEELAAGIDNIPGDVDVVVTLVEGRADHLAASIASRFPGADVRIVANRGRDVWPLLQVLDRLPGHQAVLKVHTKRSPHMRNGDTWRRELLAGLVGSPEHVERILQLMSRDPRIAIVAPAGNVLGREFLGANRADLAALARRRPYEPKDLWFPAGSMFWARPDLLADLADLGLTASDFGPETGAIDGTLAHALERYLGVLAASQGLVVLESQDVDRLLAVRQPDRS